MKVILVMQLGNKLLCMSRTRLIDVGLVLYLSIFIFSYHYILKSLYLNILYLTSKEDASIGHLLALFRCRWRRTIGFKDSIIHATTNFVKHVSVCSYSSFVCTFVLSLTTSQTNSVIMPGLEPSFSFSLIRPSFSRFQPMNKKKSVKL